MDIIEKNYELEAKLIEVIQNEYRGKKTVKQK